MDKSKLAYLYLILVIVLWGSATAIEKLLLENLDNFQILFFITFLATITLFLISIFLNRLKIIKQYRIRDYINFMYMGFLGVFLYYLFIISSLLYISAQESLIINYLWPILTIILALFILREQFTLKKIFAIVLSFIGVYIVISKGQFSNLVFSNIFGIILAFLAALSGALFFILGKKHNYEKTTSIMFYYLFSFIFSIPLIFIFSNIRIPSLNEFLGLLVLGAGVSGIAYVFWFLALKYGETSKISNIIYLTPFVGLIYIYLLVGEKILFSSIIGLIIIIIGIFIQFLEFKKNNYF